MAPLRPVVNMSCVTQKMEWIRLRSPFFMRKICGRRFAIWHPDRGPESMRRWVLLLAVVFLLAVPMHAAYAADQEQDWLVLWGQVLGRHTRAVDAEVGTRVDYRALSLDPAWPQVLAGLAEENPILLKTREQKLAFWVNAYNILAIDLVIENYPVKSIRDIGSWWRPVWKRPAGRIHGAPTRWTRSNTISCDPWESRAFMVPLFALRFHVQVSCASPIERRPWAHNSMRVFVPGCAARQGDGLGSREPGPQGEQGL